MAITDAERTKMEEILAAGDVVRTKVDWVKYNTAKDLFQQKDTTWESATVHAGKLARLVRTYPHDENHRCAGSANLQEWFLEDV